MSLRKDKSSEKNKAYMRLALELASQNKGLTGLNPSVGCVVTHKDEIISYGKTDINGRPHAEVAALKNNKINFKNSYMYVTLEPCIHYGKTPPCTNIIIKKNVKLVNYSIEDFDKRTAKKTKNVLKKNNILARIGLIKNEANHFYKDYKFSKFNDIPYVTGKLAVSKNNKIYLFKKKITNEHSHKVSHLLRYRNQAILTSYKTINSDNPNLNCRIQGLEKFSPVKFIIDKDLKTKINSNVLKPNSNKTYIFHNKKDKNIINKFKNKNAKLIFMKIENNSFDLNTILKKIYSLGYANLLLESGPNLLKSFLNNNLINDFYLFKADNKINSENSVALNSFIDLLSKKFKKRSQINTFLDKEKLFRYQ